MSPYFSSYSCGYRKAFDEYSSLLSEKYPEVAIKGDNYDPPGLNLYLSKGILVTKLVLIFILMTGFDFWAYLGQAVPGWWQWCTENKIYAFMMIFFLGNTLEAHVSTTCLIGSNRYLTWSLIISLCVSCS